MQTLKELLDLKWNPSMSEYCYKSIVYLDMGDYYLNLISSKPTISKDIYYADQVPGSYEMAEDPGTGWDVFKNYNIRLNSPKRSIEFIEDNSNEVVIVTHCINDKTGGLLKTWTTKRWHEELGEGQRFATDEEKKVILEALRVELKKYEVRLERYYKRYGNKIHTVSYWADR